MLSDTLKIFSKKTWLRIATAFIVTAVPVFFFVELADEVREREALPYDEAALHTVNSVASPLLDALVVSTTQLGGVLGVMVLTIGIAMLLWRRRRRSMAALLVTGVSGAVLLNLLLKAFFQRDRPQLWERLVTENSYSFPSGHAMASSALAISLMVIFWPTRWRWVAVAAAASYMVVIGLTRLYLGVHYPSDVLAGWAVSSVWVSMVVYVVIYRTRLVAIFSKKPGQ